MPTLDPNVAAVRAAVRDHLRHGWLGDVSRRAATEPRRRHGRPGASDGALRPTEGVAPGPVLVACSGGADSLALAAAVAFVAPRCAVTAGLVTVDHGLQPGSAGRAASLVDWARQEGLAPAVVETVSVAGRPGGPGARASGAGAQWHGPEAAAREARYGALVHAARRCGATSVLLGHTLEDQAETVLLAVLRGAGLSGLAAMPVAREVDGVRLVRPFLGISRAQTRAACVALGLPPWEDPHNADPSYARTHARALLTSYVDALGPAVVGNLARTARLAGADADVLGSLADEALARAVDTDGALRTDALATLAPALRGRVLHGWALSLGVPGSALSHRHVEALDALVVDWHGQGAVHLPGAVPVVRRDGRLRTGPEGHGGGEGTGGGPEGPGRGKAATRSRPRDTPTAAFTVGDS